MVDISILITGLQYWTDKSDPSSNPHDDLNFHPQSSHGLRNLPVGRRHNNGYEYFQNVDYKLIRHSPQHSWSRVEDSWSCPQGFEPSNGICQGKLISTSCFIATSEKI